MHTHTYIYTWTLVCTLTHAQTHIHTEPWELTGTRHCDLDKCPLKGCLWKALVPAPEDQQNIYEVEPDGRNWGHWSVLFEGTLGQLLHPFTFCVPGAGRWVASSTMCSSWDALSCPVPRGMGPTNNELSCLRCLSTDGRLTKPTLRKPLNHFSLATSSTEQTWWLQWKIVQCLQIKHECHNRDGRKDEKQQRQQTPGEHCGSGVSTVNALFPNVSF